MASFSTTSLCLILISFKSINALAVLPKWPPTYQMNSSTIIQPCNYSGYFSEYAVSQLAKYGIVSIDWSNAKALWSNTQPMDCQERLLIQAKAIKSVNPVTRVFVYRNLVKALPWFTDIREKIVDPAYSDWFLKFKADGPYNSPPCTNTSTDSKCSLLYHDQLQTPKHCTPQCDCGKGLPCGEYLYDHRNSSVQKWLTDIFILNSANNTGLNNPNIDGFFIDDNWSNKQGQIQPWMPKTGFCNTYNTFGGPSEEDYKCAQDMAIGANEVNNLSIQWKESLTMAQNAIVTNNGFNWQLLHQLTSPNATECTNWMNNKASVLRNQAIAYVYTDYKTMNTTQTQFEIDLAIFLLVRGRYAWLGYGWNGCHSTWNYQWHEMLDKDYGEPLNNYTQVNSGVFQRKYTKAMIQMDCNTYKSTIKFNDSNMAISIK